MFQSKRFIIICSICCLHVFLPAARSQNIDIDLLESVNPQNPHSGFWKNTSSSYLLVSGTASVGSLAYALIKNDKGLQYKSYELLTGIGINIIATEGMKRIIKRKRPYDQYPDKIFILSTSKGYAFPSGHTSLAFATATSLYLTHKKWYITVPAYVWAGCVGYSRLYLGKHYPSDVIGGAIVGAGSSLLSHWVSKKLFAEKRVNTDRSNAF